MASSRTSHLYRQDRIAAPRLNKIYGFGSSADPFDLTTESETSLPSPCSPIFSPQRSAMHVDSPSFNRELPKKDRRTVSAPARPIQSNAAEDELGPTHIGQRKRKSQPDKPDIPMGAVGQPNYELLLPADRIVKRPRIPGAFPDELHQVYSISKGDAFSLSSTSPSSGSSPSNRKSPTTNNKRNRQDIPREPPILLKILQKTPKEVHDDLRKKFMESLTPKDKPGMIYIIRDPKHPELGLKIGSTKRADFNLRLGEHHAECGFEPEVVHNPTDTVEHCLRVEKLVHCDLAAYKRHWRCHHKTSSSGFKFTTHDEWFAVSPELAIQTVKKWEAFVRQQSPYTWFRQLNTVWNHLMTRRNLSYPSDIDFTHDARREQWAALFAPPTTQDYIEAYRLKARRVLKILTIVLSEQYQHLCKFLWQYVSVSYGLITYGYFHNAFALYALLFVLACAAANAWIRSVPRSPRRKARKSS